MDDWKDFKRDMINELPETKGALDWIEGQFRFLLGQWRSHRLATIVGMALLVLVPISFAHVSKKADPAVAKMGQVGDFIAGTLGTTLGVVSVVALFVTLKNDRLAREEEGFEDKYYELLKLHRANVAEIRLGSSTGRRVFVLMIREFRAIHEQVENFAQVRRVCLSREQLISASYFTLFYGVGPNSSRMLAEKLVMIGLTARIADGIVRHFDTKELKESTKAKRGFGYTPFEGHQSRLGHYYRHLYQLVSYVHLKDMREFAPSLTPEKEKERKRTYVKTIRAQLSTHEQALLFINSLTPIGSVWWKDNLMVDYGLVKNLPITFFEANSELDVKKHIPQDNYFEDDEVREISLRPRQGWPELPY